eukprot:NODE_22683_length_699_cov_1.849650.p3 GENE.NODE_22683_length_699_cov_1.849650~~NODE_22683_length_699_cov_1.849650.p3  ORF type:complete len:93 (-),score=32.72 NODE_22683_length_699_cov_1.849650:325-603(-)
MAWSTEHTHELTITLDTLGSTVKILDKATVSSVSAAVDRLNGGSLSAPDGFCVVWSASSEQHFVLYTEDAKDAAYHACRIIEEEPVQTGMMG